VITIARLTIGEAARRKVLWVLVILAAVAVALVGFGVERLVTLARQSGNTSEIGIQVAVSQILIVIAWMFGFVLAMTSAFLAAPAVASDLESGVALALLARPIRRSSYLLGRWLGLAAVVAAYGAGMSFLAIVVIERVSGYSPPTVFLPLVFIVGQGLVVLSLSLLFSTRLPPIAGGAIAVVAYGLSFMAGTIERVGIAIAAENPSVDLSFVGQLGRALLPTDGLWRGVIYGLEPQVVIAIAQGNPLAEANPFYAATPPTASFLAWAVVWVILVMILAAWSLRRREL
jgi:ABC-type transport system involved in multi-copper enzyme maturation permease subunit